MTTHLSAAMFSWIKKKKYYKKKFQKYFLFARHFFIKHLIYACEISKAIATWTYAQVQVQY